MKSATSKAIIRRFGKPPVPILASVVAGATPAVCSDSSCVCFLMAFLPARGGAEAGSTPGFRLMNRAGESAERDRPEVGHTARPARSAGFGAEPLSGPSDQPPNEEVVDAWPSRPR